MLGNSGSITQDRVATLLPPAFKGLLATTPTVVRCLLLVGLDSQLSVYPHGHLTYSLYILCVHAHA